MNQHKLLSVGVGALLILGIVGGAGFSNAIASSESPLDIGLQDDGEEEEEDEEEEINVSQIEVSAQQAIEIAENETNGTVVELELMTVAVNDTEEGTETADDNETTDETETLVWEVELLSQNGTEQEVLVDATDGTVLGVETDDADEADDDDGENEAEGAEQVNETTTENGDIEETETTTQSG